MTETFEEKLNNYMQWAKSVGIKYSEDLIQYPVYFQPGNYPGIGVKENIPTNKAVISVPYPATITLSKAKQTLGELYDQIKKDFDKQQFFAIVFKMYLCYEKSKVQQSFFYHYFNIVFDLDNTRFWTASQMQELEDPYIIGMNKQYQKEQNIKIQKFQQYSKKYTNLFKKSLSKQQIQWADVFVQSRSFETGFPEPIIVPFLDFVNHVQTFNSASTIYSCKVSYEKGIQNQQGDYIIKNKCLYLQLLNIQPPKDMKKFKPHVKTRTLKQFFPQVNVKQIIQFQPDYLTKYLQEVLPKNPYLIELLESQDDQQQAPILQKDKTIKQKFKIIQQKQQPPEQYYQLQQIPFLRPTLPIGRQTMEGYDYNGWWKYDDKDCYVILTTCRDMEKGQQLCITYGRKSNINLLRTYGFALQNNRFQSVNFYLKKAHEKIIVYQNFLTINSQQSSNLIGFFQLKQSKLCPLLIMYLRFKILKQKQDYSRKVSYPVSLKTQLQILDLYQEVLIQLRKIYNTQTLQYDKKLLQQGNNTKRITFALIHRILNKKIIEISWSILQMTKKIIKYLQNKRDFKEAINEPMPEWQRDELFDNKDGRVFYLRRLLPYLRPLTYLIKK